jgi:hypothetical protein
MKVLAFGGRHYTNYGAIMDQLAQLQKKVAPITLLIHGGAIGADIMAAHVAQWCFGIETKAFPADWNNVLTPGAVIRWRYGKPYNAVAGHWRNQQMIDEGEPEYGIGFPGGTGTADMAERLRLANIPIWNAGYENG